VKLFEHPDFEQAIIRAAEHFRPRGLREAIIEKDYFVTEALRIIEQAAGCKVIFKGGTSLSKGWNLIQRFSEDIGSDRKTGHCVRWSPPWVTPRANKRRSETVGESRREQDSKDRFRRNP
jgi:nucleotidyltransferase AbiEii toxin of type IV toxin-antitoxin system